MIKSIIIQTKRQGLIEVTNRIDDIIRDANVEEGLCTVFSQHSTASLIINDKSEPAVTSDLENWLNTLVKEDNPLFTHLLDASDDMAGHIKSALTAVSISIPILHGQLALGTWQALYLWEHKKNPHHRTLLVHIYDE